MSWYTAPGLAALAHDAAFADSPEQGSWRLAAACRFTDPDLFFPISSSGKGLEQAAQARAICACCPVQRQCRAFALRTREQHGIWGGMTEDERDQLWRQGDRRTDSGAGDGHPHRLHGNHQTASGSLAG